MRAEQGATSTWGGTWLLSVKRFWGQDWEQFSPVQISKALPQVRCNVNPRNLVFENSFSQGRAGSQIVPGTTSFLQAPQDNPILDPFGQSENRKRYTQVNFHALCSVYLQNVGWCLWYHFG